ncbi:MAG: aspartate aminotransferase family protein [Myxococcota bacterium]|nr:aspartate aminotransferase family protein [Myxococcota bacterium]
MATQSEAIIEKAKAHLLQNYRQSIVIDRGLGSRVWDSEGKQYLDLLGGIATCALGHCHPEVGAALKAQIDKLWHVSNVFYTQPQIDLAQKLTAESGLERAFFCNSGAEANEAVLKLARKAQKDRGQPERFEVITFLNSFHGRTLATVTATGQPKYQKGFEPLPAGFTHVPYGDLEAVKKAVSGKTAAILVEPIQGEGGVHSAPEGFLRALRTLCDEQGLLLLVDEIQTGMGRTGKFFAYQHEGIRPDAITLAKALGNGIPIGAMLCREEWAKSLTPGTHGSTFGGNPLAAAAANVVTDLIRDPKMLASVSAKGELFLRRLGELKARHPQKISAVRGRGLLIGLELTCDAGPYVAKARDLGLLCNLAGDRTLRFAPAFTITEAEIEEGVRLLDAVLQG